jgi:hypothetical protein
MEHIENHPHAFIGSDNIVVNVAVYNEHDETLLNQQKILQEETFEKNVTVICCCNEGLANIGETFLGVGKGFLRLQPYPSWVLNEEGNAWNPPIPCPTTTWEYYWSEEDLNWISF